MTYAKCNVQVDISSHNTNRHKLKSLYFLLLKNMTFENRGQGKKIDWMFNSLKVTHGRKIKEQVILKIVLYWPYLSLNSIPFYS